MLNSNELINKVKVYNKFLNHERLDKAYNFAIKAHQNQRRASGDPYSVHPIEVANILTELKLDSATTSWQGDAQDAGPDFRGPRPSRR